MAWVTAPQLGTGGNEPTSCAGILDASTRLKQGPLLSNNWFGPLVAQAPDVIDDEVHGYAT